MDPLFFQEEKIGLQLPSFSDKVIFYSVLNWGIGHATRSIPIINHYLALNNQVIIFSDGEAETILKKSFPNIVFHTLPSYKIQYKSKRLLTLFIALQSIARWWVIWKENKLINRYQAQYNADISISDNRYGCYVLGKKNYIISHQLKLVSSHFIENFSQRFISKLIKPFDELWIPDIESVKLSGQMTEVNSSITIRWIGFPYSIKNNELKSGIDVDILILLSGPEPRRSELEATYLKIAPNINRKVTFIAGNFSEEYYEFQRDNLTFFSSKKYEETIPFISNANVIICRSGYSTLIDLYVLKKDKIICIPTAGQPEQEYLASYWSQKGWVKIITESSLEIKLVEEIDKH
jgi:predicted glycosyltransferase